MARKQLYLVSAIIGTIILWLFFATFLVAEGVNLPLFLRSLFVNGAAGGFSSDVILLIPVFWIWSFYDARQNSVKNWWVVVPTGCFAGLSLALPLYLF